MKTRNVRWLCVLLLVVVVMQKPGESLTIQEYIGKSEHLTELLTILKGEYSQQPLGVWGRFSNEASALRDTFFAPVNEAFKNIPASVKGKLQSTSTSVREVVNKMMEQHVVSHDYTREELRHKAAPGCKEDECSALKSQAKSHLFFFQVDSDLYVNGAKLLSDEIQCENGIIHLINIFFHDIGVEQAADSYIESRTQDTDREYKSSKFLDLLYEDKNNNQHSGYVGQYLSGTPHDGRTFVTVFAPTDKYLDDTTIRSLKMNQQTLHEVLGSHVIARKNPEVYHTGVMERVWSDGLGPIDAVHGQISVRRLGQNYYVSNNCAQGKIIKGNMTVSNGVVHFIDGLMDFLSFDAYGHIKSDRDLHTFQGYIDQVSPDTKDLIDLPSATTEVSSDRKYTIFAPIDSAFRKLEKAFDLTQSNKTELNKFIKNHMIKGIFKTSNMKNGTTKKTEKGETATFFDLHDEYEVEVNHVQATIVRPDVCVQNGIIHYVDRVLGSPLWDSLEEINTNKDLREFYQIVGNTGLENELKRKTKKTIFAPNNDAIMKMRQSGNTGRMLLENSAYLKNVIKRHIVTGREIYLADQTSRRIEVKADFPKEYVLSKTSDGQWEILYENAAPIRVVSHHMRMTDGVMYLIDGVIFEEGPQESALTSTAAILRLPLALLLLAFLLQHAS